MNESRILKEIIFMTRNDIEKAVNQFPVAVLPVGSTEQHGPHLPLGVDTILAEFISREVCLKTGAILLPSIPFGYSWVWRDIPGTLSINEETLKKIIKDLANSLSRFGIKILAIINGHDANNSILKYVARELQDETDRIKILYFFYPDYEEVMKKYCSSETWYGLFHADEFETSLMLAIRPQLVNMRKAVSEYPAKPDLYGKSTISLGHLSKSGVFGDPTKASKEKGNVMLDIFINKISKLLLEVIN